MDILFIGGIFDKELEVEILEKSSNSVQYAANKFQWNLINGFLEVPEVSLRILSAPFIGAFPREYKDLHFSPKSYKGLDKFDWKYVGFNNLWGYRSLSRALSLKKNILEFAKLESSKKIIMVYSVHTPFLIAAIKAKKLDPTIQICLVIPDLPQYMNLSKNKTLLYRVFKYLDVKKFEKLLLSVDSFVLLTEEMAKFLNINKPYTIVEGIVDINNLSENKNRDLNKNNAKIILYTGTLNEKFGVVTLVDAFTNLIDKKAKLIICGSGDSEDYIRKMSESDNRIIFKGQVDNKTAMSLQQEADILINPRQNTEDYTKYSFPSKNMEYLLSGKPVIAYKLDGIPQEYNEYFLYVEDNSVFSLTEKLNEVLSMSYEKRSALGIKGREFVMKNKNTTQTSKKIIQLISK